jgi:hypothetical protein
MKSFENNAQYTSMVHSMVKHKVQGILWDLLWWLDSEGEIQSVRDILSYIRLFTDFGDNSQGRLFFDLIKTNRTLRLVLPEIASRLVSRGKATGSSWLEDLGRHIQELHRIEPHPGVGSDRENMSDD